MAHVTNLENEELLDNLTVSYFEILQELLEERQKLELAMRGGFLEIAKSRHNMGSRCVSSIQLPSSTSDKCYQADFKVETSTLNEGLIEKVSFHPLTNIEEASVQKESGSGGLRKRILEGQTPDLIKHVNSNLDSDQATGQKKTAKTNSLKWFGILLPNSLRSSKLQFDSSLISVCKIASLQVSLIRIQNEFKKLTENV